MAQSEIIRPVAPTVPSPALSLRTRPVSPDATSNSDASDLHDAVADKATPTFSDPPAYFNEALQDAERMLKYASEIGTVIDADTRNHVLQARAASSCGWNEEKTANLLTALTTLAAHLRPVTAESLKACSHSVRRTVRTYWWVAIGLAIVIVPFSLLSFVSSAISTTIRADIATSNDLAVKLRAELGPSSPKVENILSATDAGATADPAPQLPAGLNQVEVIADLQLYASNIRSIDARARQLNALVLHAERDPFLSSRGNADLQRRTFQLPLGLPNLGQALDGRTYVYQEVRYFAQSLLDDVSFYYGAITACLLPVLYALLGTCAYLLRTFEKQMALRTFTPSRANSARFLIAAIGGAVVGLFNNFTITQGASIPPLALAFLVGYAVDVFFAFLEGLLQVFTKNATNSLAPTPASGR